MRNSLIALCAAGLGLVPALTAGNTAGLAATVRFEENRGQTDPAVRYVARVAGQTAFFTDKELVLELAGPRRTVVRLSFPGRQGTASWEATTPAETISYYVGNDPRRWVKDAPRYERLCWRGIYPGVDAVFYGRDDRLEYDLVLAPGADPSVVRLRVDGPARPRLQSDGAITVPTPAGPWRQRPPLVYQEVEGTQHPVAGRFVSAGRGTFRLALGRYAKDRPLVVDPILEASTYLGGEGDDQVVVAREDFVAGNTTSLLFPGSQPARRRSRDIFLRVDSRTTILGGSDDDELLAADSGSQQPNRPEYVLVGATRSRDFPQSTTASSPARYLGGASDGFLVQIGSGVGPGITLIGGSSEDRIESVYCRGSYVYFAGTTDSPNLPMRLASQPALAGGRDGFVGVRHLSSGSTGDVLTYLGGSGDDDIHAVATDPRGRVWVGGETRSPDFPGAGERRGSSDGFLTSFAWDAFNGARLQETRLIGGGAEDRVTALAFHRGLFAPQHFMLGVAGTTASPDFPLVNPVQERFGGVTDAFVQRLAAEDGTVLLSTYVGGSAEDEGLAVALNLHEDVLLGGATRSADLAVTDAVQDRPGGGVDGLFALIEHTGRLRQLTYLGGSADDRILSVSALPGAALVGGETASPDLPMRNALQGRPDEGREGFLARVGTAYLSGPERVALGKDMIVSFTLWPGQAIGGAPLTARSSDPSKVRFWQGDRSVDELTLTSSWSLTIEALADAGDVEVTVTAPGLEAKVIRVTLYPTVLVHPVQSGLTLTTWSAPYGLYPLPAAYDQQTNRVLPSGSLRAGVELTSLRWTSSDERVIRIGSGPPSVRDVPALVPEQPGTARITLSGSPYPVYPAESVDVTVRRPSFSLPVVSLVLPRDLQMALGVGITNPAIPSDVPQRRGSITFRSLDPDKLLLSLRPEQPGEAEVTIPPSEERGTPVLFGQALQAEGQARVLLTSPDVEADRELVVTLARPVIDLNQTSVDEPFTLPLRVGESQGLTIRLGEGARTAFNYLLRPGAAPLTVQVASATPSVAAVQPTQVTFANVPGQQVSASRSVAVRGVAAGDTTLAVSAADVPVRGSVRVTVDATPFPAIIVPAIDLGKDLQATVPVRFTGNVNGEAIITVDDPSLAVVSADARTTGSREVRLRVSSSFLTFVLQGLAAGGETRVRVRVPGVGEGDAPVRLGPAGFAFSAETVSIPFHTREPSLLLRPHRLDEATGLPVFPQVLRPGVRASVALRQEGDALHLQRTTLEFDGDRPETDTALRFTARATGEATLSFDQPAGFTVPARRGRATVEVVPSRVSVSRALVGIKDVMTTFELRLDGSPTLTGVPLTISSSDPARLLLSATGQDAGSGTITRTSGNLLRLYGLADSGSVRVRIEGEGIAPEEFVVPLTPFPLKLRGPLAGVNTLLTPQQPGSWRLDLGEAGSRPLALRPGASPVRVEIISSDPRVVTARPNVVELRPGAGSVSFEVVPGAPGEAELQLVTAPGYEPDRTRVPVRVRAARLVAPDLTLGKDQLSPVTLRHESGFPPPASVIVTVTSLHPDRVLVARSVEAAPTASITTPFLVGASESELFLVHALAGEGTAQLRVTAEGYAESIMTVTLVPTAVALDRSIANHTAIKVARATESPSCCPR